MQPLRNTKKERFHRQLKNELICIIAGTIVLVFFVFISSFAAIGFGYFIVYFDIVLSVGLIWSYYFHFKYDCFEITHSGIRHLGYFPIGVNLTGFWGHFYKKFDEICVRKFAKVANFGLKLTLMGYFPNYIKWNEIESVRTFRFSTPKMLVIFGRGNKRIRLGIFIWENCIRIPAYIFYSRDFRVVANELIPQENPLRKYMDKKYREDRDA